MVDHSSWVRKHAVGESPQPRHPILIVAALTLGLWLGTRPAGAAELPPDTVQAIDSVVEKALADTRVPSASIVVVKNDEIVLAKAYGKARLPDVEASPSMRYKIASNSKQLTAAAILLLAERHKLSIDDKVSRFLPSLTGADKVTIRNLLTHTSGYQDFYAEDYLLPEMRKDTTPQHILDVWGKKPLDFAPGTRWQYSNTNYVIAGRIVEQITHMPLMAFLHQEIFDKLGMKSPVDIGGDWSTDDATGYTTYGLGPAREVAPEGRNWLWAAGELGMTASDLARWDISLMKGEILSPASTKTLTTQMTLTDGTATNYALGLAVKQLENAHRRWAHTGGASGFHSMNALYPDDHAAITVLTNGEGHTSRTIVEGIETLLLTPATDPDAAVALSRARALFTSLQAGKIDRAAMTPALNDYFSDAVLTDFAASLGPLGEVEDFSQSGFEDRGGMVNRVFKIKAGGKTLTMDSYLMPDGKWEQCLIFAE
jgi:CubicO group peptidase (beta-lactamase class C family)